MMREEASKILRDMLPGPIVPPVHPGSQKQEAIRAALTAMRGPTREMVERMFPGCEVCKSAKYVTGSVSAVAPYDDQHETETYAEGDFDFCPNCGRPLTDEAVDIELRRWKEALHEIPPAT